MARFVKGDRVRVDQPMVAGEPYSWHGNTGEVVRVPGEEATPGTGPSTSYAMTFDGREGTFAPFRDDTMDERYFSLIVPE